MDDLRVESYDEKEVAAKKRSTLKRVALAGGAIVLILGMFGILWGRDDNRSAEGETYQQLEDETPRDEERAPEHIYFTLGGSGSWFTSVLERF